MLASINSKIRCHKTLKILSKILFIAKFAQPQAPLAKKRVQNMTSQLKTLKFQLYNDPTRQLNCFSVANYTADLNG